MSDFTKEIIEDINWRVAEIATAKTLPYRYNIPHSHREFLIKHSIPIVYATWEGYVRTSIEIYARELNKLGLKISEFSRKIVTNSVEIDLPRIKEPIYSYDQSIKLVDGFICYIDEGFKVSSKVPSTNNINIKILNQILDRFNIQPVTNKNYEVGLNKLLKFRNAIAHGDNSINFKPIIVSEFSTLVMDLMYEVFNNIDSSYKNQTYRA